MIDCEDRMVSASQFATRIKAEDLDEKRYFGGLGGGGPMQEKFRL
jgi:hypothetical protein